MITYEYHILYSNHPELQTQEINKLGQDGWELFLYKDFRLFFRRVTTAEWVFTTTGGTDNKIEIKT